jgi:hypothetical protein
MVMLPCVIDNARGVGYAAVMNLRELKDQSRFLNPRFLYKTFYAESTG